MQVNLPYGKGYLKLVLPDGTEVFGGNEVKFIEHPEEAIKQALLKPTGSKPLAEIIRAKRRIKNVCIVVSDHTRAVPNKLILPPLLEAVEKEGIPSKLITILIASGVHRPTSRQEKIELMGEKIAGRYRVIDHNAKGPEGLVGLRYKGKKFYVNRLYAEADLKILTGLIEPHFMAGFSGGRKAVCPGIAGIETIKIFHGPAFLESPFAGAGTLYRNPCHRFALEMVEAAGADFILNVTLNKEKKVTGVFGGDVKKAHSEGIKHCRKESLFYARKPFKAVITSNGGYPLDRDLYQTVKGLVSAADIVAEGGEIICFSECVDGIGSENFRSLLFGMGSPDEFLRRISRPDFFVPDQWEVEELIKALKKAKIKIYSSGLKYEEIKKAHMVPLKEIDSSIRELLKKYGGSSSIAVIPDGPYTMVKIENRRKDV